MCEMRFVAFAHAHACAMAIDWGAVKLKLFLYIEGFGDAPAPTA